MTESLFGTSSINGFLCYFEVQRCKKNHISEAISQQDASITIEKLFNVQ